MIENEIVCGNSLEVLRNQIEDRSVDIIVTSPPYNIDIPYDNYKDNMPRDEYLKSMLDILTECYRVLKKGGRMCLNVPYAIQTRTLPHIRSFPVVDFTHICNQIGFELIHFIVWQKGSNKATLATNTAWGSYCSPSAPYIRITAEPIMIFYKEEYNKQGDKSNIDITPYEFKRDTQSLWYKDGDEVYENVIACSNSDARIGHPAPFPQSLVMRLLKLFSYKNDLVLDPFNGSGATTAAAAYLGRRFIGIDLSEKYCKMAKQKTGLFAFDYSKE